MLALSCPYVGPIFAVRCPIMSAELNQNTVTCPFVRSGAPLVPEAWPWVDPIWPLCWPYLAPMSPHRVNKFSRTPSKQLRLVIFSVPGTPWTPKPRKTRGFLTTPRWNSDTPKATKHRKTRCFLTPRAKNTVIYRGSGGSEVTMRWPPPGSAAGAACLYNLRLPTEGLRQGHGLAVVAGARI